MELKLVSFLAFSPSCNTFNRTIVELKLKLSVLSWQLIFAFNRTIVELKPFASYQILNYDRSFNRTIVELKQNNLQACPCFHPLLIGPLWNWNQKSPRQSRGVHLLLIGPLWNWNISDRRSSRSGRHPFNRTIVELKRKNVGKLRSKGNTFNRTIVELKPVKTLIRHIGLMLLIGPLWNWNYSMHINQTNLK